MSFIQMGNDVCYKLYIQRTDFLQIQNINEYYDYLEEVANTFCYSNVLYAIPISFTTDDTVLETANLLTEPHKLPLILFMILLAKSGTTSIETT